MKKNLLIMLFALLSAVGFTQTTEWTPVEGGDGLWSNAENWSEGVPTSASKVVFNNPTECVFDMNADSVVKQVVCGDGGDGGVLTVKNGSISTAEGWSAFGWNTNGTLNVEEGAAFTFASHMWIGWNEGSVGTININGGTVTCGEMFSLGGFETSGAGVGIVNINSGTLVLSQMHSAQSIFEGSSINIDTDGVVVLPKGSKVPALNYVKAGKIKAVNSDERIWYTVVEDMIHFHPVKLDKVEVLSTKPADGDVDVKVNSEVVIEFLTPMNTESVASALSISPEFSNMTLTWDQASNTTLTITGDEFAHETEYAVTIGTGATDINDNTLAEAYTFSFVTDTAEVVAYAATFTVSDANGAVEGAVVTVDGADYTTDASGVAVAELFDGEYEYSVSAAGHEDATGTITVAGADVEEAISLTVVSISSNELMAVTMYPNPFNNQITLVNASKVKEVYISNIIGQKVLSTKVNSSMVKLNVTALNKGIYMVTIVDTNNNTRTKRLVKN